MNVLVVEFAFEDRSTGDSAHEVLGAATDLKGIEEIIQPHFDEVYNEDVDDPLADLLPFDRMKSNQVVIGHFTIKRHTKGHLLNEKYVVYQFAVRGM